MRMALILATGLLAFNVGAAQATPLSEPVLDEAYRSCVAAAQPGTPADLQARYCGCFRGEMQRNFTQESLAALETRMRANQSTMMDRDQLEGMQRTCAVRAQQAPSAPPVSTPVPAPQATPAPQPVARPAPAAPQASPQGTPLTAAELDTEERSCIASMEQSAPPNVTAEMRRRFCGCTREWMQTTLTRETLAGLNQRQTTNTLTMQDRDQMQEVFRMCVARAQQTGPASTPPPPPRPVTPAPQTNLRPSRPPPAPVASVEPPSAKGLAR